MQRVTRSTAVAVLPAVPASPGTPGFFTGGNPGGGIPPTVPGYEWHNGIQEELIAVIVAAGLTPSSTDLQQLLKSLRRLFRTKLTAATTFYVAVAGNDTTGDGSSGAPFATVTGAWNYLVRNIDVNGQAVTIQVGNGTYTGSVVLAGQPLGAGQTLVLVLGDTTTPSNVAFNITNGNGITATYGARALIRGCKITASGSTSGFSSSGNGLLVSNGAIVQIREIEFGACGYAHLFSSTTAQIALSTTAANSAPYSISGGAVYHALAADGGLIQLSGGFVTLTGTPGFSGAFAQTSFGELLCSSTTFSGGATGVRYNSTLNGLIGTNGGGASFFPGNASGTFSTGGLYV